jgi:hypothetical protein
MKTGTDSLENFWEVNSSSSFDKLALDTFNLQYKRNTVYRSFCNLINRIPCDVKKVEDIPYLPISFFKSKQVVSFQEKPKGYFSSSKTSGLVPSKHFYRNLEDYTKSFSIGFGNIYGKFSDYVFFSTPSFIHESKRIFIDFYG